MRYASSPSAFFQRPRFVNIVERRGGTVGVDIVEVGGWRSAARKRPTDSLLAGRAVFRRGGKIHRVGEIGVAGDFRQDRRPRARALSRSSRHSTAPPSESTNPLRCRLNGQLARSGDSVSRLSAPSTSIFQMAQTLFNRLPGAGEHHAGAAKANRIIGLANSNSAGGAGGDRGILITA